MAASCVLALSAIAAAAEAVAVPNPGFEAIQTGTTSPEHWIAEIGGGAKATVERDAAVFHTGKNSIRITNQSPTKAFVFASIQSDLVTVRPQTTYVMRFWARGRQAKNCFASVSFENDGEHRLFLPSGDIEWKEFACRFSTSDKCSGVRLRFASDGITGGLWIDDVSLEVSPKQLVNLVEKAEPRNFEGFFPRSRGPVARNLVVCDLNRETTETGMMIAALQGIVNRRQPRIYLINKTNPAYYDEIWLKYMRDKDYTGREERLNDPWALVKRFKGEISGVIIYDTELPGSLHAARMLAGIKNALPVTPELAAQSGLPVDMDLRGKWKRNVDAYRYVFDNYWDQLSHHVIAWEYPFSANNCCLDYITQFKVPCFWVSTYADNEKGADPPAEEEFLNDLLAATPGNVPCMGWPMQGDDKGVQEYSGVRWLSEYGKWMPGTGFDSNMSVHSAIHPPDSVFRQKFRRQPSSVKLEDGKVYITVNIMDSGDALWYWLFHQRKIWSDPVRGLLPIGYGMDFHLYDVYPLVMQWYYENATPNDSFFGLIYLNTQVYGSRFRKQDSERIWNEFVEVTDKICGKTDIDGLEIYNGSWGEVTPPSRQTFERFTKGMKNLNYILADLGRHNNITTTNSNYMIGNTAVFHTLTRFQVWSTTAEALRDDRDAANAWLLGEIKANTPAALPAFMSAMAISWYYYPSWLFDLKQKLPSNYVVVSPGDLARLFKQHQARLRATGGKP